MAPPDVRWQCGRKVRTVRGSVDYLRGNRPAAPIVRAGQVEPPDARSARRPPGLVRSEVVDTGELPALLLLISFGATFGITRFITHSIRSERFSWLGTSRPATPTSTTSSGGSACCWSSGLLAVAVQPPLEVTAIVFGIGAALTLDEFALWLHLDDVYWSEQGRQSIDAVIVFAIVSGFMVVGAYPVSFDDSGGGVEGVVGLVVIARDRLDVRDRLLPQGQADLGRARPLLSADRDRHRVSASPDRPRGGRASATTTARQARALEAPLQGRGEGRQARRRDVGLTQPRGRRSRPRRRPPLRARHRPPAEGGTRRARRRPRARAPGCCCGWRASPVWLAGIAADALGFVGQAVALTIGRLAVVQPLLATSMVFALPLGHRLTAQRVTRSDVGAAVLVTASLIAFLTIANPSGGRDDAPIGEWLVLGGDHRRRLRPADAGVAEGAARDQGDPARDRHRHPLRAQRGADEVGRRRGRRPPLPRLPRLAPLRADRRRLHLDDVQPARADHRRPRAGARGVDGARPDHERRHRRRR